MLPTFKAKARKDGYHDFHIPEGHNQNPPEGQGHQQQQQHHEETPLQQDNHPAPAIARINLQEFLDPGLAWVVKKRRPLDLYRYDSELFRVQWQCKSRKDTKKLPHDDDLDDQDSPASSLRNAPKPLKIN